MKKMVIFLCLLVSLLGIIPSQKAFAADNYIYQDKTYKVRLDPPHFSGADICDVYHVHFYKNNVHIYCMRLDNLKVCDNKKSDRDKVPEWLMDKILANSKVQKRVKDYNPAIEKNSGLIRVLLTLGAGILVILAAINVFAGPADDIVAWSLFLSTL